MKLVVILGDAAVGKMTVGQELMRRTGMRLFHNHMTIEPVIEIFGEYNGELIYQMRELFFHTFAKSDKEGVIFTYMMDFDMPSEWEYLKHLEEIFEGSPVYYVELHATQEVRLARNVTENRLKNKASKRDIETSNMRLIRDAANHRCVSLDGEVTFPNYIKIDNTNLEPEEVVQMIIDKFGFETVQS